MGVGEFVEGLFASGAAKLTNTNRAYYMRSLFLVSVCRSLPEIDLISPSRSQNEDLTSLFRHVEKALKKGTLSWGKSTPETSEIFIDANTELEKYIKTYRVILKARWANGIEGIISFEIATQKDFEAIEQLKKYKQGLDEEISQLKKQPCVKLDVVIWKPEPIEVLSNGRKLFNPNSTLIDHIKIEDTASFDILMHRIIEYTALKDRSNSYQELRKNMALDLYPQFYEDFPTYVTEFNRDGRKTFPSFKPWEKVSKVNRYLHIIVNRERPRGPGHRKISILAPDGRSRIPDSYTNAWFLASDKTSKSIAPDKMAARQRTISNSLCLWNVPSSTNIPTEDISTISGSTAMGFPVPMPAVPSTKFPADHASVSSDTTHIGFPEPNRVYEHIPASSDTTLVGPTDRVQPLPLPQSTPSLVPGTSFKGPEISSSSAIVPEPTNTLAGSSHPINDIHGSYGHASIRAPINATLNTPASDSRAVTPEQSEVDPEALNQGTSEDGLPLPGWKAARHRRPDDNIAGRVGVAPQEKAKPKKGFFQRLFGR